MTAENNGHAPSGIVDLTDPGTMFECHGIKAGYGPVTIVPLFDLSAPAGTVVAVLGPNGAGKTTLLSTLAGLLPAQGGTVAIDGQVLKNGRPAAASRPILPHWRRFCGKGARLREAVKTC